MSRPTKDDPDKARGIYRKFEVFRVDEEAQLRHTDCRYYVLDLDHDKYARVAIAAYAAACAEQYPKLASDLLDEVRNPGSVRLEGQR